MNDKAKQLEVLYKTVELRVDDLINSWDVHALNLMLGSLIILEAKTKSEELIVTSVHVKAIIKDDLVMIRKNLETLKSAVKLKEEFKMDTWCLN